MKGGDNMKCPFCKSNKILKQGVRYNATGKKQKFQCKDCDKWFVKKDGFERMRHKKKDIVRAIHLHSKKYSLAETVDQVPSVCQLPPALIAYLVAIIYFLLSVLFPK